MWKLLRNLALGAILLAGMLKLGAWYEVGQDAQRITAALAPYAQIKYDSISAGLDGSVSLSGVSVAIKRGAARDTYTADSAVLETPSIFWLLKHALLGDNNLPSRFGISTQGLKLAAAPWLDPQWLNPATLVPFETAGCGASAFTSADYTRMGVTVGDTQQHLEYRHDADTKLVDLTLTLSAPAFAKLILEAELHPFDPNTSSAPEKLHIDQLSADYADSGYLRRRNEFCAQREKIDPKQFAEQHVAAVQTLLAQHHIQASAELVKLYRHLVDNGGQASVLSLPNSSFVVGAWHNNTPEDVLRQLNVTARYGDSPPVMFRVSFPPPADVETALLAPKTPVPSPALTAPAVTPSVLSAAPTPVATPLATPVATPVAAPEPITPAARAAPDPALPIAASAGLPKPAAASVPTLGHAPTASLPLRDRDRAEAQLPPPVKPAASPGVPEFLPSVPPPNDRSTLALVWKPTLERLDAAPAPEQLNYDVIEYARLKDEQGRRVRLITDGGKKLEGYVLSVDDAGVALRINRGDVGGDVRFVIPKARIQQIQLLHRASPPA